MIRKVHMEISTWQMTLCLLVLLALKRSPTTQRSTTHLALILLLLGQRNIHLRWLSPLCRLEMLRTLLAALGWQCRWIMFLAPHDAMLDVLIWVFDDGACAHVIWSSQFARTLAQSVNLAGY